MSKADQMLGVLYGKLFESNEKSAVYATSGGENDDRLRQTEQGIGAMLSELIAIRTEQIRKGRRNEYN